MYLICRLVEYVIARLNEFCLNGITPYVVFDGANLPNKQKTDETRALYE